MLLSAPPPRGTGRVKLLSPKTSHRILASQAQTSPHGDSDFGQSTLSRGANTTMTPKDIIHTITESVIIGGLIALAYIALIIT